MKVKSLFVFILLSALTIKAQPFNLEWAKSYEGTSSLGIFNLALDPFGNIYATGYFQSTVDFDPGAGVQSLMATNQKDMFVLKMTCGGNFVWVKKIGGLYNEVGQSIAFTVSGNILVAGYFEGNLDLDPGIGVTTVISNGMEDAFLLELDSGGNFIRQENWGGNLTDIAFEVVCSSSGDIYTSGIFSDTTDMDPFIGTNFCVSNGTTDIFIMKQDSFLNLKWVKCFGGSSDDRINALKLFADTTIYCAGTFLDTADFNPNAGTYLLGSAGLEDVFLSSFDSTGDFNWARTIGGNDMDVGYSMTVDIAGNSYVAGTFRNTADFNQGLGLDTINSMGSDDGFVCKHDQAGNFRWAKSISGPQPQNATTLACDSLFNLYLGGSFYWSADFDPSVNTYFFSAHGNLNADAYLTKWDSTGSLSWIFTFGNTLFDGIYRLCVSDSGYIYSAGYYGLTVDFDPGPNVFNMTSLGADDVFLMKTGQPYLTVGENPFTVAADIKLYPNPANNHVWISSLQPLNAAQLRLYNCEGQLIREKNNMNGTVVYFKIDDLQPGIYLMEVSEDSVSTMMKLIVY